MQIHDEPANYDRRLDLPEGPSKPLFSNGTFLASRFLVTEGPIEHLHYILSACGRPLFLEGAFAEMHSSAYDRNSDQSMFNMDSNVLRPFMLFAGQRASRGRRSGSRSLLVRGVRHVSCEETEKTQKVGLQGSVFHFIHQSQTTQSSPCPTPPLHNILVGRPWNITTQ